nr:hypothetical protein [Tanacetum cinerariifolium]
MYKEYATKGGFEIKRGGQHNDSRLHGLKKAKTKRSSCRIGCQAKLVIKLINGNQYVLDKFVQRHNHYLVDKENLQFLRSCRKLTFSQKVLIHQISNLNMGPVRVFKLMKEMYNMVLVPFTGIANHNRCVTFGVGLIARETSKSYRWLLKSFKQAFRRSPKVFVTDQDASIKKAIAKKVSEYSTSFMYMAYNKEINIKDKISPEAFEEKWASRMTDFNLQENKWLYDMYQMRGKWIPAYLCDEPMTGLMRTSS